MIHERVCGIRCYTEGTKIFSASKNAWTSNTSMAVERTSSRGNDFIENQSRVNNVYVMCTSITNAFYTLSNFYKVFMRFQFYISVFLGTIYILIPSVRIHFAYIVGCTFFLLEMIIFPISLCVAIQLEFQKKFTIF